MLRALLQSIGSAICATAIVGCGSSTTPTTPTDISTGSAGGSGGSSSVRIVTMVDVTTGLEVTQGGTGTFNWIGQSLVVPGPGKLDHVRFNWYKFNGEPTAFGKLYVLGEEFLGIPGELGSSTRGFVGVSDQQVDGEYVFPASVTLLGGTRYWFYTDTQGSCAGSFDTDLYAGGDEYVTGWPTSPFRKVQASGRMVNGQYVPPPQGVYLDANFRLQGNRVE